MIHKFFPSWLWLTLVVANILFLCGSVASGMNELIPVNVLSAAGCWVGYRLSKNYEDNTSHEEE